MVSSPTKTPPSGHPPSGDPPVPVRDTVNRPLPALGLVAAGGAIGALTRWAVVSAQPQSREAATVLVINVTGSLLLGFLLGRRRTRQSTKDLVGTGFAGGFTTFSTFAVDVARRLDSGDLAMAATNGLATPLLALLAAGIGYRLGRGVDRLVWKWRRRS